MRSGAAAHELAVEAQLRAPEVHLPSAAQVLVVARPHNLCACTAVQVLVLEWVPYPSAAGSDCDLMDKTTEEHEAPRHELNVVSTGYRPFTTEYKSHLNVMQPHAKRGRTRVQSAQLASYMASNSGATLTLLLENTTPCMPGLVRREAHAHACRVGMGLVLDFHQHGCNCDLLLTCMFMHLCRSGQHSVLMLAHARREVVAGRPFPH